MKAIVYERSDGGVSVVYPVRNTYPQAEEITDEQMLERALRTIPRDAANVRTVEASEIPADRIFRNAWTIGLEVDMPKARAIYRDKLREARAPLLAALDAQYLKADEAGDTAAKQSIAAQKQVLRDCTKDPAIERAATPDDLKAVRPDLVKIN